MQCTEQVRRDCGAIIRRRLELHASDGLDALLVQLQARFVSLILFEGPVASGTDDHSFDIEFHVQWGYVTAQLLHIVIRSWSLFSVMGPSHVCSVSIKNKQPVRPVTIDASVTFTQRVAFL